MPSGCTSILSRLSETLPWAFRHLLLSLLLAGLVATLVFGFWFPPPYAEISGGLSLFVLLLGVDVVCGPLLSLLLLHPSKSRRAFSIDLTLIGCIQVSALAYGMYTLSHSRPLALVFEVDRFRVVAFSDVPEAELAGVPAWMNAWGLARPRILGTRIARSGQEKLESVEKSLQGVEPSQRPDWWQDYVLSAPNAIARSQPLELLQQLNPGRTQAIQAAAAKAALAPLPGETDSPKTLRWLPVVSRHTMDWVVLVDPRTARVRGYVHADGFGR